MDKYADQHISSLLKTKYFLPKWYFFKYLQLHHTQFGSLAITLQEIDLESLLHTDSIFKAHSVLNKALRASLPASLVKCRERIFLTWMSLGTMSGIIPFSILSP